MIRLRCPICASPLEAQRARCDRGHSFPWRNDVLELLDDEFGPRLRQYEAEFRHYRRRIGGTLPDSDIFARLPGAREVQHDPEWQQRVYDLAILKRELDGRPGLKVLDVGAWNGWLSHRLAGLGQQVTAIDYFSDPHDGLAAKQFYPSRWNAIQMDLLRLDLIRERFDVIVLNRCLQFFPSPLEYVRGIQELLKPGGRLYLTGLQIFMNPSEKARAVARFRQEIQVEYGFEIFIRPTRGYLDSGDWRELQSLGIRTRPYRRLWMANFKARLRPIYPRHFYGIYHAN